MQLIKTQMRNDNGNLYVSSRIIAREIRKQHGHVLRDLEKLRNDLTGRNLDPLKNNLTTPNLDWLNLEEYFIFSEYKDRKGEMRKEALITKKGFSLYMSTLQGHTDFKIAYISEFDRMERVLNSPNGINLEQARMIEKMTRRSLTDVIDELAGYGNLNSEQKENRFRHYSNLSRKCVNLPSNKILPKNKMSETQLKLLEGAENFIAQAISRNIAKRAKFYDIYPDVKRRALDYFGRLFKKPLLSDWKELGRGISQRIKKNTTTGLI